MSLQTALQEVFDIYYATVAEPLIQNADASSTIATIIRDLERETKNWLSDKINAEVAADMAIRKFIAEQSQ